MAPPSQFSTDLAGLILLVSYAPDRKNTTLIRSWYAFVDNTGAVSGEGADLGDPISFVRGSLPSVCVGQICRVDVVYSQILGCSCLIL